MKSLWATARGRYPSAFCVPWRAWEYLQRTLGEKFRPSPLLVQYVKAGRLGRKVGRGVYDYPE